MYTKEQPDFLFEIPITEKEKLTMVLKGLADWIEIDIWGKQSDKIQNIATWGMERIKDLLDANSDIESRSEDLTRIYTEIRDLLQKAKSLISTGPKVCVSISLDEKEDDDIMDAIANKDKVDIHYDWPIAIIFWKIEWKNVNVN